MNELFMIGIGVIFFGLLSTIPLVALIELKRVTNEKPVEKSV